MASTIKDVAKLSGVSPSTVTRVIQDKSSISEATKKKVREAMASLNYHPNVNARSLASNKTNRRCSSQRLRYFLSKFIFPCGNSRNFANCSGPSILDTIMYWKRYESTFSHFKRYDSWKTSRWTHLPLRGNRGPPC